jgi:outer membrane protein W
MLFLRSSSQRNSTRSPNYFNERARLGVGLQLGLAENAVYSVDFTRFFTDNVAVELGYTTSRNDDLNLNLDVDIYRLSMAI